MSTSEKSLRDHIRKHYAYLVDELDVLMYMDLLYQEEVVSRQEKESLEEQRGRSEQARRFVDGLMRKPELSIRKFLGIVEGEKDKQPHIYETVFPELTEHQSRMPEREVPGRSQAIEDPKWAELSKSRLQHMEDALRPTLLLDPLLTNGLLTLTEYKLLQSRSLTEKERSKLLRNLLPFKGQGSFSNFCSVLLEVEGQQAIVTEVLKATTATSPEEGAAVESAYHPESSTGTSSTSNDSFLQEHAMDFKSPKRQQSAPPEEDRGDQGSSLTDSLESGVKPQTVETCQLSLECEQPSRVRKRESALFYFRQQLLESMKPIENTLRATCSTCFGVERAKVIITYIDMDEVKEMLTSWKRQWPFIMNLDSKLGVLLLNGVKKDDVGCRCDVVEGLIVRHLKEINAQLQLPIGDCSILEVVEGSTFVIILLGFGLYISLLCLLGDQTMRIELLNSLQQVLPGLKKAVFRLGGLPPLELNDELVDERSSDDRETSVVTVMDQGLWTFLRLFSTAYCNIDFL